MLHLVHFQRLGTRGTCRHDFPTGRELFPFSALIYNVNIHQSVLLSHSAYINLSPWNIGIVESLKPVPKKIYSVFVSFKLTLFPNKWFLNHSCPIHDGPSRTHSDAVLNKSMTTSVRVWFGKVQTQQGGHYTQN